MQRKQSITAIIILIILWHILSIAINKPFLPTPIKSFQAFFQMIRENKIQSHFLISSTRVLSSIILAIILAMPLGILMGLNKKINSYINPFITVLYPIPKVVFLPIFTVLMGLGNAPKIVLISSIIFFQILVPVRDSAKRIPRESMISIKTITQDPRKIFIHLIFPWCLPELLTSIRISIGTAIAVLFFAETFASFNGLGYLILDAMERRNYPDMYSGIIAMAMLGIILYEIITKLENKYCKWKNS